METPILARLRPLLPLLLTIVVAVSVAGYGVNSCRTSKAVAKIDALDARRRAAQRRDDSLYFVPLGIHLEITRQLNLHPAPHEIIPPAGYALPADPPRQQPGR